MIVKGDVVQITDKEILDAMAFTLYGESSFDAGVQNNHKEFDKFVEDFVNVVTNPHTEYRFLGMDSQQDQRNYHLKTICTAFNNWRDKRVLVDQFIVKDCYRDYFTIKLLGISDRYRKDDLVLMHMFLAGLKIPYSDQHAKFYRMGCNNH